MGIRPVMSCTPHTRLPSQQPQKALQQGWEHRYVSSVLQELQHANRRSQLLVELLLRKLCFCFTRPATCIVISLQITTNHSM